MTSSTCLRFLNFDGSYSTKQVSGIPFGWDSQAFYYRLAQRITRFTLPDLVGSLVHYIPKIAGLCQNEEYAVQEPAPGLPMPLS
jgi:hypothetical protein